MRNLSYELRLSAKRQTNSIATNTLENFGKSLELPPAGSLWNGVVDIKAWQELVRIYAESDVTESKASQMHFGPLLEQLKIEQNNKFLPWATHAKVIYALKALAIGVFEEQKRQRLNRSGWGPTNEILWVATERLIALASQVTGLDLELCRLSINALRFNQNLKRLDIWDMPLIPVGNEIVLFVPTLVWFGDPLRSIENFMAQWKCNDHLFDRRGKLLEQWVRQTLEQIPGVQVQAPVIFFDVKGQKIECDIVAVWDGHILLIEAKCTKSVVSPADHWHTKKRLLEAIEQLKLREKAVKTNWAGFKMATKKLDLPVQFPDNRVHLIAVTNVLDFTGWRQENVVVTDQFCFARFFGEQQIPIVLHGDSEEQIIGSMGTVRPNETPTVHDLLAYLADPPQVRLIRNSLTPKRFLIPNLDEQGPRLGYFYAEYTPNTEQVGALLKTRATYD